MKGVSTFAFQDPGPLSDGELSLVLVRRQQADLARGWVPGYEFEMRREGSADSAGRLSFRAVTNWAVEMYAGHIGYSVEPGFRGRHFAERAVRLLLPFVRRHGFESIWITCNPDNLPSRRTCERLGAVLFEVVPLPPDNEMYARGDREKCRYRLDL
jgi:tagatose 1,6-diphosphate aldolase